jgi:phosphoglycolate phosphatase-like HAD superfamily hydrolase
MTQTYKAPDVLSERVTPEFVRDELLSCFESANREFATLLKQPVSDEQLKQQVKQFVESVFINCGASYTEPTKEGILTAMNQCRSNAEKMMGPQGAGIIQHHYDEMMKLVDRLQERPVYAATSRLV